MTVWLGVYIGSNETVNEEQKVWTLDVLQKYGTDHVSGVTVGNEYIHNQDDQATATEYIVSHMNDVCHPIRASWRLAVRVDEG